MKIDDKATLTKPLYVFEESDGVLHISKGNSKVGKTVYTFSTLPGNADHLLTVKNATLLTSIPGTCSGHCEHCFNGGCYAVNSAKQHHNAVIPAWAANTILLRSGKLFEALEEYLADKNQKYAKTGDQAHAVIKIFRINVSGEIQDAAELESWNNIAGKHPEIRFGLYTKNYEALEAFMQKHGDTHDNFVINVSQWHGAADAFLAKYPGRFNIFEYDDSNLKHNTLSQDEIMRLSGYRHCPAVNAAGEHAKGPDGKDITCDMCGRCYRKSREITAVFAH